MADDGRGLFALPLEPSIDTSTSTAADAAVELYAREELTQRRERTEAAIRRAAEASA